MSIFAQKNFQPNKEIKIEINNEAYQAEISLEAGRFVQVEINSSTELTVKVFEPNGSSLADNNFWKLSTESKLSFITKEKGNYKIEIKADYPRSKSQSAELKFNDLRQASERDFKIIELQNLRREVKALDGKKDEESKSLIIKKNEVALDLAKQLDEKTAEGEILTHSGYLQGLKNTEKGAEAIWQSIEIFKQTQDNPRLAHAYFISGINYYFNNKPNQSEGLTSFQKCVEIGETQENNLIIASCLINIGGNFQTQGELSSAVKFYERALSIFQKYGVGGEIVALRNLVVSNTALGNVPQTLRFYSQYNEALARHQSKEDCDMSLQIAFLQYNLQNWKTSRELFKTSRNACLERKNLPNAALALVGEGAAYTGENESEKALPILNSALAESRKINSKLAEATSLAALGIYYDSINDSPNALKFLEESKPLLNQLREVTLLNIVLTAIGKNRLQNGEIESAETTFRELLERSRNLRYARQEAAALFGLARVADQKGDLIQARKNIEDSIKIIEVGREQIPTDALRVSFFSAAANYYDFYTDLLMRLHHQNPAAGLDKIAFQAAESSDARSLLNQLREAGTDIRAGVSPDLIAEEKRLRENLNAQNTAQLKMQKTFTLPTQLEKVRSEISRLNAKYEQIQAQIVAASPAFAALTQPKPLSLGEIQKQLDKQTILLKYSLGEEKSYLFAVTSDTFKTFELPKRAEIETKIWSFRRLLTVREQISNPAEIKEADAELVKKSAELSEILLEKVGDLANQRLAIIPSGALHFIPFAALQSLQNKEKYLIESNEITILPSASVLAVQRQEKRNSPMKTLAVFADPVYEKEDPRLLKAKTQSNNPAKSNSRGEETNDFLTIRENLPDNFARLLYSRREANQILALVPGEKEKFAALDFEANRLSATTENLRNFRYLHFAAHGIFNAQNPNFSGIVLSLLNKKGEAENGLLSLQDVYNLQLNSELVVLSACRTGLGKQVKGEGVVGLTRGFMYAGSRRVVASLWKVQDDAAAGLMTEFYRNILQAGKRPAEAMRLAQISLLKKNQYSSPFFWGAFVHYGEWQ